MALTMTIQHHWMDTKKIHVRATVIATGVYTTGGDVLTMKNSEIKSDSSPEFTLFQGLSGYGYRYVPGTNRTNGKLKVFLAGTEIGAGAYPAAVLADIISFYGIFRMFL